MGTQIAVTYHNGLIFCTKYAFIIRIGGTEGATVNFNGASREATFVSSTHLTAEITAEELADAGTYSVIKTQYNDNDGNLYKPEEDAATFAAGTFNTTITEPSTEQRPAKLSTYNSRLKLSMGRVFLR